MSPSPSLVRRRTRPRAESLEVRSLLSAGLDPDFLGGTVERLDLVGTGDAGGSVVGQFVLPGGKTLLVVNRAELTTLAAGGIKYEPVLVRLKRRRLPPTRASAPTGNWRWISAISPSRRPPSKPMGRS